MPSCENLKPSNPPSSAEEGWLRHQENAAKLTEKNAQTGWCWSRDSIDRDEGTSEQIGALAFADVDVLAFSATNLRSECDDRLIGIGGEPSYLQGLCDLLIAHAFAAEHDVYGSLPIHSVLAAGFHASCAIVPASHLCELK